MQHCTVAGSRVAQHANRFQQAIVADLASSAVIPPASPSQHLGTAEQLNKAAVKPRTTLRDTWTVSLYAPVFTASPPAASLSHASR